MHKNLLKLIPITTVFGLLASPLFTNTTLAFTLTDQVPSTHNLYYEDWGHPFNILGGNNEEYAIGRGEAPVAFGDDFAFSAGQKIDITATNCTVDSGSNCTSPDGASSLFRDHPVYSMIGVWSSSTDTITPVENSSNPAFFIGSAANLQVPDFTDDLYLFLATNDGNFSDNSRDLAYNVTISGGDEESQGVPEPSTAISLAILGGLGVICRYKTSS